MVKLRLTAQQASLVRAVALKRADYLQESCRRDPATGARIAHPLAEEEWSSFKVRWAVEPIACIRELNGAIGCAARPASGESAGREHRAAGRSETDMGRNPSRAVRIHREKITVDKQRLKPWLIESKWRSLAYEASPDLLAGFYQTVRRSLCFEESAVRRLSDDWAEKSINLSQFLEDGVGLCRHMSILYQLCLQEAAIPARVAKGSLRIFGLEGRHAWNLAWFGGRMALIDVTMPSRRGPMIVLGASQEEVYRLANQGERRYLPTSDDQNCYHIGSPTG